MIYFGVIVGAIIMIIMISMAVNKKSDPKTRMAAVIALAVMVASVIICVIIIFTDTTVVADKTNLIVGEPPEIKETSGNVWIMFILIAVLLGILIAVAYQARKEAKKHMNDTFSSSKPISNW